MDDVYQNYLEYLKVKDIIFKYFRDKAIVEDKEDMQNDINAIKERFDLELK